MIEVVYPNCAGVDVHKKFVTVCRLTMDKRGRSHKELRQYDTMTADLEAMAEWLSEGKVTHVAMESTGTYWHPVNNILEGRFEIFVVNAQAIKRMPGRKTDMKDAEWLATLLQHGLLQRSFIPDRQQRELRELARYRQTLVQERSRFASRLQKVLEDTNIKLSAVATDMQGVSAQTMLRALIQGEADPKVIANMAKGRMRKKQDKLARALVGKLTDHHRFMLSDLLDQLDFLGQRIAKIEERIEEQMAQMPAFQKAVILLDTIPGVDRQLAILIVAEIGIDMSRFPSDRHITAWAGVAPGNNQTGGKQRSGKTRKGNKYLRRALVLAAWGAVRSKPNYLRSQYYRLAARRGKLRATMAVGRSILQAAYHMLLGGEFYQELGADYFDQLDREGTAKRLLKRLDKLGYDTSSIKDRLAAPPPSEEAALPRQPLPIPT